MEIDQEQTPSFHMDLIKVTSWLESRFLRKRSINWIWKTHFFEQLIWVLNHLNFKQSTNNFMKKMSLILKCFKNSSNQLKTSKTLFEIFKKQFETRRKRFQPISKNLINDQRNLISCLKMQNKCLFQKQTEERSWLLKKDNYTLLK